MNNRRILKVYKFKSARIEIYVDEHIGYKQILKVGKYELREETITPFIYLMKVVFGNVSMINNADTLQTLKHKYMLQQSKLNLRKANVN